MNVEQALAWADGNTTQESVDRLRSRKVAKVLSDEVRKLRRLLARASEELYCGDEGDVFDRSHRCGKCDEYVDRNGALRTEIAATLPPNV